MAVHPTLWLSFAAGLLSFISPCFLPLYPSYISYISGVTFSGGNAGRRVTFDHRKRALFHTFFFVLGFSMIFFALGLATSLLGQFFADYRNVIRVGGGIIIIVMGLVLSELVRPKWLMKETKWEYKHSKTSYFASVLVGISFAAGWTPCIGPILASVLVMTMNQSSLGIALILAYIVGFAVPFFILAFTLSTVRGFAKYGAILSKIGGYLMIVLGLLLATNLMSRITVWTVNLFGGFGGF